MSVQLGESKVQILKGGSGDPVVVLHQDVGNPGWLPFHELLSEQFTVFAPALPGFDKSDRPDWARNARDLAALQQWVLKSLNLIHVPLVGLGFGGWIAAEMVTFSPAQFKALVLVGAAGIKPELGEIMDQFLVPTAEYTRAGFYDQTNFNTLYGADPDLDQLETWEINREMTTRVAWKPYLFNPALPHLLPMLDVPSLVVWGRNDQQVPLNCGELYARSIPGASLKVLDDCGHYVEVEKPHQLAKLTIDFLAGL